MANMEKLREAAWFDFEMDRKYLKKVLKSSEATAEQKKQAMKRIREDDYWIRKIKKEIEDSNSPKPENN